MKNLIVAYSDKYKGLGVFADRDYDVGEVVNTYDVSNKIDEAVYNALSQNEKWKYSFDTKNKVAYVLDEVTARINHSCTPNIDSDTYGLDLAIRPIKKDEEITASYMNYSPTGLVCLCGSSNCLGKVSLP